MEFKNYRQLVNTGEMTSNAAAVEITEAIPNLISYVGLSKYDEDEIIDVWDMYQTAKTYVDATTSYDTTNQAMCNLADYLVKTLVYGMYFNRSFEISSSAKNNTVVRNIIALLSAGDEDDTN